MKYLDKLKENLGLCSVKGCYRKAVADVEIKVINHKGCLCEKHYDRILDIVHDAEINKELNKFQER